MREEENGHSVTFLYPKNKICVKTQDCARKMLKETSRMMQKLSLFHYLAPFKTHQP